MNHRSIIHIYTFYLQLLPRNNFKYPTSLAPGIQGPRRTTPQFRKVESQKPFLSKND